MERLQKVIAAAGVASRRKAEQLIVEGKVTVNGQVVTQLGVQVGKNDVVAVEGEPLKHQELVYYLVNKPRKYVSTADDEHGRDKVTDLVDCQERIFPVGRLDYDSTGLIILTNDGDFTNKLTHPRYHLPKTYRVTVNHVLTKNEVLTLRRGIKLDDGYVTSRAEVQMTNFDTEKDRCTLEMTIYEGKNRQIRRMIEALGYEVTKLHRISFGCVRDDQMPMGSYRRLRPHEIKMLKKMAEEGTQE